LKTAEDVEGDLIWGKGDYQGEDCDGQGAEDEDETSAVDVGETSPEEEEAGEGEGVGGDDPLLAGGWDGEGGGDCGEDDYGGLD